MAQVADVSYFLILICLIMTNAGLDGLFKPVHQMGAQLQTDLKAVCYSSSWHSAGDRKEGR